VADARALLAALVEAIEDAGGATGGRYHDAHAEARAILAQPATPVGALDALLEAARLRRNVLIYDDEDTGRFRGEWVAVPREDFDALRDALAAASEPAGGEP